MASSWGSSWGVSWGNSWGSVTPATSTAVTTAGRRQGATSYSYRTLGSIHREKKRELERIARQAEKKVAAAVQDAKGLQSLVRHQVAATVPENVSWLTPAMLNGIIDSIVSYHRAIFEREALLRMEQDEDDIEVLLLSS